MKRILFWLALGALIAWFADPVSGAQRRAAISDLAGRTGGSSPRTGQP